MRSRYGDLVLGRQAEADRALTSLTASLSGRGGTVLITGPAGIGKTWLAQGVRERLPRQLRWAVGAPIGHDPAARLSPWRRAARVLARSTPGGPLDRVLHALGDRASDALPPGHDAADLTIEAFVEEWSRAPFVLFLDDLQHFDDLSLAVFGTLCDPFRAGPVSIIAACTTAEPVSEQIMLLLGGLTGRDHAEVIELPPLPAAVIDAVIERTAPGLDPDSRATATRLSSGNPRFAVELARAFATGPADGAPSDDDGPVGRLIAQRLAGIDPAGVLAALALLGRPASLSLLAAASGTAISAARGIAAQAAAAGLLTVTGTPGVAAFSEPGIADAIARHLDPVTSRRLHYRLATLVCPGGTSATGPCVTERARHLLAAGDDSDATARACLEASLAEERQGQPGAAAELVRYGLDLQGTRGATRAALLVAHARALARDGDLATARDVVQQAAETARALPDGGDGELLAGAVADLTAIDPQTVNADPARRDLVAEALRHPGCPDALRPVLLARLAEMQYRSDADTARRLTEQAVMASESAGLDEAAIAAARSAWLLTGYTASRAEEVAAETRRLAARGVVWPGLPMLLAPSLTHGDRGVAEVVLEESARRRDRYPLSRDAAITSLIRLGLAVCDGDARAVATHSAAVAATATPDLHSQAAGLLLLWRLLTRQDVSVPLSLAVVGPPTAGAGRLLAIAEAMLSAGAGQQGAGPGPGPAALLASLTEPRGGLLAHPADAQADVATALTGTVGYLVGDPDLCAGALARLGAVQDRFLLMSAAVPILPAGVACAWAHAGLGDLDAALAANEQATAVSRRAEFGLWAAHCLLQRAQLLQHADPRAAASAAAEARTQAASLGLADLQPITVRPGEPAAADSSPRTGDGGGQLTGPAAGPSPLTPAQEQMLALAAAGLTNDQVARRAGVGISTVEKHFTQVYRRLGVPNRASAIRWYVSSHGVA